MIIINEMMCFLIIIDGYNGNPLPINIISRSGRSNGISPITPPTPLLLSLIYAV